MHLSWMVIFNFMPKRNHHPWCYYAVRGINTSERKEMLRLRWLQIIGIYWCLSLRWDAHHHNWHAPVRHVFLQDSDFDGVQCRHDPRWRNRAVPVSFTLIYRLIYVKLAFIISWISCLFLAISQCSLLCFLVQSGVTIKPTAAAGQCALNDPRRDAMH